jgi:6-pyruvoyl-tetrahydropterin synthase
MFRVGIKDTFTAQHALIGDFDEETVPHEHTYVVEWMCITYELDDNGFSVDIAKMEESLHTVREKNQGVFLNDLPFFENKQTSVENLAAYLYTSLFAELRRHIDTSHITESEVRVWESDSAWASFSSR